MIQFGSSITTNPACNCKVSKFFEISSAIVFSGAIVDYERGDRRNLCCPASSRHYGSYLYGSVELAFVPLTSIAQSVQLPMLGI
jgi:hypothetical protein